MLQKEGRFMHLPIKRYDQCDQIVYKSCLKMISLEKLNILTPLQKLPKNMEDLGKLIVGKGFEKLPNVQ